MTVIMRPIMLLLMLILPGCTMAPAHDAKQAAQTALAAKSRANVGGEDADAISATAMGPVCWAAIVEAVSSYGERCLAKERPEFRAALNSSREKFDRRFRTAGWSEQTLAAFKVQMSETDKAKEEVCSSKDAEEFYRSLEAGGAKRLEAETDSQVARPGQPQWGTCL